MTYVTDHDPGVVDFEPEVRDLVAELFPVEVSLPDGTVVRQAKVFVLNGGIVVYGGGSGSEGHRVFASRHAEHPQLASPVGPKRHQRSTFTTHAGIVIAQGVLGCGCGSPLKTLTFERAFGVSP